MIRMSPYGIKMKATKIFRNNQRILVCPLYIAIGREGCARPIALMMSRKWTGPSFAEREFQIKQGGNMHTKQAITFCSNTV